MSDSMPPARHAPELQGCSQLGKLAGSNGHSFPSKCEKSGTGFLELQNLLMLSCKANNDIIMTHSCRNIDVESMVNIQIYKRVQYIRCS